MPDASGKIRGIALTGRAAASWERIFGATQSSREVPPRREPPVPNWLEPFISPK